MRCCTVCSCGAWIGLLGVGLLCIGLAAGAEAAGRGAGGRGRIQPAVLRCEYAHNPLGIDVRQPRLSWILEAGSRAVRGEEQTAYQVLVGTDEARLRANRPDLWNSGKVLGRNSVHVPYSGKPLRAGVRAFWKVRVWDRQGNPSEFSPLAWWEMGLLEPRDWRATWITRGDAPPASDRELFEENPAPLFRRELNLTKSVARARAYVSGLGYYELRINGARVGDQVLDPGWTTYSRRVLYSTYDVTSLLRRGRNALGMMLGNGWYNPLPLRMWNSINLREHLPVGQPRAILHLEVEYTDGTRETVGTDKSWRAGDGPILKNSVYLGELYDARREQPGWDQPGFDDSQWRAAAPAREEVGPLRAQTAPPIRVSSVIRPIAVTEPKPGVFIVDMGENFAGWVQLRVRGEAGAKVTLRYGELLYPDGTLNPMTSVAGQIKGVRGNPAVGAPETAWQTDAYILKGGGDESYTPRFTFHGFRYVELTGYPGAPTLDTLRGLRLNSSVDRAGAFACSNPLLNRIQDMVIRTQLSNMFSVQSDCPHREKFAYGGDIVATSEMAILNFDMARFYAKTVRDHHDAARPNGGLTETAPFVGIADSGLGGGAGPVEWGTAHPLLLWQMYQYYGDRRLLAEQYETARRWVALIQSQAKGHILDNGLSDHESLVPKPVPLTGTAFYYLNVQLLARIAGVLGHTADAERYSALAGSIREAFNQRFLQAGAGRYGPGTQVSQAAALYLGLVPPTEQRAALGVLKADVLETHKGHLSTGIFGTKFLLHTLSDHGMSDVAYTVVNQRDFPGWGHMLERGATTLWEHWEFSDNTFSHNHPMFGSVSEWFYKDLAGIRPGPAAVGFDRIIIRPRAPGDLTWVRAHHDTVRGRITSAWMREAGVFTLNVTVPVNSSALVYVPARDADSVTESGKPSRKVQGVQFVRMEEGAAVYRVGSGSYAFASRGATAQ